MSEIESAAARIARHARRTPLLRTTIDGRPLVLKLEHLQRTGSFKFRGALNALLAGEPDRVVTASGGNHGLAVATAAKVLGIPATVYVPLSTPDAKARRIAEAGAELIRAGDTYAQASKLAQEQPGMYLPAYNHPDVVAGQGTVAAEIVTEASDVDTIVVAVGGGGLAAGTVLGAGGRRIVAVEPENCQALHDALAAGAPVDSAVSSVASSALGATRVGELPFRILRSAGLVSVLVNDDQIIAARDRLWEEFRLAVEPAAAAPLAAWLAGLVPGELPCLIVCGANTDWTPN